MSKAAIIYWSGTGNTKIMADAILEGMKSAGAEVDIFDVTVIDPAKALEYEKIALGCPSMGVDSLEEDTFEPFYDELSKSLKGKKIALFGSYDWGDGEWMRNWQADVESSGGDLYNKEGLIVNLTPDEDGVAKCKSFGEGFAKY